MLSRTQTCILSVQPSAFTFRPPALYDLFTALTLIQELLLCLIHNLDTLHIMEFPHLLGLTDPCSTAVHMEPFSTSFFKVLVGIFATTTKTCTSGGFTQACTQGFGTHHHDPPTDRGIKALSHLHCPDGPV